DYYCMIWHNNAWLF
nr:immunoglobulin light chain junction region [Macaca mulatta]MOX12323.1 immunoglobulin light chain junction region [Macaca mulatta]MOX13886.1 immunoglobulin light chain junction region [Macaca mulatta]MOY05969.1 immunoglobulin light chain junction region [Macaca mulatta]MOY06543.1 immunoglobulin light chain junction region [Macaca mulatta]